MKLAIVAIAGLLSLGAQADNYIKKCGADYGKFIKGTTRVATASTTITSRFGVSALSKRQAKAFTKFGAGKLPLEVQSSVYLSPEDKVAGHRVRIMKPGVESTKVYFYFNTANRLLRTFEKKGKVGTWVCEGYKTLEDEIILDLARDLGEYVSSEDMPGFVSSVATKKLPKKVQKLLTKLVTDRAQGNCRYDEPGTCRDGAMDSEEHFVIMNDGEVIGYILNIWDSIDHPLWDGSGVYHYIKASNLKVLTSSNWEG